MLLKHRCVCVRVASSTWHGGSVACTAASQQEGHGFDSRMGRCWLWGAGPPQSAQCSSGLSPRPFCVEFACSPRVHKGVPPLRTPTEKHAKRTEQSCPSLTETDGSLGPRALQAAHCSWGVLEEGQSRMGKSRHYIHRDLRLTCVCVCPVSPPYMHVCVPVCCVCH